MLDDPVDRYDPLEIASFIAVIGFCKFTDVKNCLYTYNGDGSPEKHGWKCCRRCRKGEDCKGYDLWKHWVTGKSCSGFKN